MDLKTHLTKSEMFFFLSGGSFLLNNFFCFIKGVCISHISIFYFEFIDKNIRGGIHQFKKNSNNINPNYFVI